MVPDSLVREREMFGKNVEPGPIFYLLSKTDPETSSSAEVER